MESNNISKASALDFATSFGTDTSLIKKSYFVSILFITIMFFIVFPQRAIELPTGTGGGIDPRPIDPRPWTPRVPPHNTVYINSNAPVIPDPTPNEPEVTSEYIPDDQAEYDSTYEGDWLFDPGKGDDGKPVQVAKPECYEKTEPNYPELARKAGIQGTVVVKIIIETDSRIRNAEILSSPGPQFGFDEAALNAVKQWRCNPAMIDGRKMETEGIVSINFRIRR